MFSLSQVSIPGFDSKGTLAIDALVELQKQVLSSDSSRDFKPSQMEIVKISSLIFKARVNNQPLLNQWFLESVNLMVNQVTEVFNKKHEHEINNVSLLSDCLQSLNVLIKFIYFSAVFIIDAKESNRLFTLGIQDFKEKLIQPLIPKLIVQIMNISRTLTVGHSMDQLEEKLQDAKQILQIIRACGWQDLSIVKERGGRLILIQLSEITTRNTLFNESFEKPYVELLLKIFSEYSHKSPLTILANQIELEHKILQILAPHCEATVMDQIEAQTILKVVQELESYLTQEAEKVDNDEIKGVIQLFQQVARQQVVEDSQKFEIGVQFLKKQENYQELPIKPFKILSQTFKRYFLTHQPPNVDADSLILYIQKYGSYVSEVLNDQQEIKLVFQEAIEIISNGSQNLCDSLLNQLQVVSDTQRTKDLLQIVPYIHQPQFLSAFGEQILENLGQNVSPFRQTSFISQQLDVLEQMRVLFAEGSIEWYKLSELILLCHQFKNGLEKNEKISIQIPLFCNNEIETINVSKLPQILQDRLVGSEKIILNYGYSIAEYNNFKLILSSSQIILLMIIQSRDSTNLEDLQVIFGMGSVQLTKAISSLKCSGLINMSEEAIKINESWQPEQGKNTLVLIDQ